jgi:photosystem II stability/assembly factor-like uncharacterized protein
MIRQHKLSVRGGTAAWVVVALAVSVSACGGAGAKPDGQAATRETAASPSDSAPARVPKTEPVWLDRLQMVSATTGWALLWPSNPNHNSALAVARTTDGGRTWTAVTPPSAVPALATGQALLQAATAQRAWITVTAGDSRAPAITHVFSTTDGGLLWQESAAVGGAGDPVAIDFAGPRRGWLLDSLGAAMGQNPVSLYRSTDGGVRWSLVARSPRMAGDPGTSSGLPVACDKDGVAFESAMTGWITSFCPGGTDAVLTSTDGGPHWAPASLPAVAEACHDGCEVPSPEFAGGSVFLFVGAYPARARLLVSTDHGLTWQDDLMPAGAGQYPRVKFFTARDGIAVSALSQGRIGRDFFITTNGGLSWTAVRQGLRFSGNWNDFDFVSLRAGFSWTYPGGSPLPKLPYLFRTSDSGRTWTSSVPRLS